MALDLNPGLDLVLAAFSYTEWQTYVGWVSEYIVNCDDHGKQGTSKTRPGDKPPDPKHNTNESGEGRNPTCLLWVWLRHPQEQE